MTARSEKISHHNHYRVYITCDNGVTFSATIQGYSEPPPENFMLELFRRSNIKEWFIEVAAEVITEQDQENKCLEIIKI